MQTLTEGYYGHIIRAEFNTTPNKEKLEFIPDSVKEVIFSAMTDNSSDGEFTEEETNGYSGTWRIQPLAFSVMKRISTWSYHIPQTNKGLTLESFQNAYGAVAGEHFYHKWHELQFYFFSMISYFGHEVDNGQIFCNMIMEQVEEFEKTGRKQMPGTGSNVG